MGHKTKSVSLYPYHIQVVRKVQEKMKLPPDQGFSRALQEIIRKYDSMCKAEQGENKK